MSSAEPKFMQGISSRFICDVAALAILMALSLYLICERGLKPGTQKEATA